MNTKEITGEQISAFADGECADSQVEATLATLRKAEGKAAWDIYHQIGDVLRSDDMAVSLSSDFSARMAARLDAEPTIVAPAFSGKAARASESAGENAPISTGRAVKRWALPGMAAAAAAAVMAFFATPQLMVAKKSEPSISATPTMVASTGGAMPVKASVSDVEHAPVIAATAPKGVVLRDPRIDDYLLAHQGFSPSVFSTAQYARSATFETDSNK